MKKKEPPSKDELDAIQGILGRIVTATIMHSLVIDYLTRCTIHFQEQHGMTVQEATKKMMEIHVSVLREIANRMEKDQTEHQYEMLVQAGLIEGKDEDYPQVDIKAFHEK